MSEGSKFSQKRIVLTGNSCFKIANFREGLVRVLIDTGCEVVVLAPIDSSREALVRLGCRVVDLPMDRNGTAPLAEAAFFVRLFYALLRERPDFVFSYTIKNNIYGGLASRILRITFVPNVTGLGPAFNSDGLLNLFIRLLYRVSFAKAVRVFFQNAEDQTVFLSAGLTNSDCSRLLLGSGVDLAHFAYLPLPQADNGFIFIMVSRLLWDKGVGLFVDAARFLKSRHAELRFQILGPIDQSSRSTIGSEQLNLWIEEGFIEYLGETSDVRPAMATAHCIVLPTWYREGTPRVLLEAAALGRPAITTNTAGCRDAVVDGKTGFLCEPRSLQSLISAMERIILMSPQERNTMGESARALAEFKFDELEVIKQYTDLVF